MDVFQRLDGLSFNRFHGRLLALTTLILVAAGYNSQIVAYVVPTLLPQWGLSPVKAGAMVSWGFVGLMIGAVGFGTASDRLGRKRTLIAVLVTFSVFNGLAAFAPGFTTFCLLRFLAGLGMGGAIPLTITLLSEFSPAGMRAKLLTVAAGGFTFGWAVAAATAMVFIPLWGWRSVLLAALCPILLVPVLARHLPESVRFLARRGRMDDAKAVIRGLRETAGLPPEALPEEELVSPPPEPHGRIRELFVPRLRLMTILIGLTYLVTMIAVYGLSAWLPALLVGQGFSMARSYSYGMLQAIGATAGGVLLGYLMDAFGRKWGLIITYACGGLSVLLFAMVSSNLFLFIAGAASGVFVMAAPTALHVVCGETYPTRIRSTGMGWAQATGRVGSILGPLLGGVLQSAGVRFGQFFLFFAAPCFICLVLVALYRVDARGRSLEAVEGLPRP